jgi:hypothetical protein
MALDSAYTSTRQIPATFKKYSEDFRFGVNFDFGGGKYDDATKYLETLGATNLVYDPYNRSSKHNEDVKDELFANGVNTITCLNVLNVIKDQNERHYTISQLLNLARASFDERNEYPVIFIQVYAGNGSGVPSETTTQLNKKPAQYMEEIEYFFKDEWNINRKGNIFKITHI